MSDTLGILPSFLTIHCQFLYTPFFTAVFLSAMKFSHRPDHMALAFAVHAFAWICQFAGHGFAEKRSPAILDNILGGAAPHDSQGDC